MRTGLFRSLALLTCIASTVVMAAEPTTEDEKAMYALGEALGRNIAVFRLTPAELELIKAGMSETAGGKKPKFDIQTYMTKLQEMSKTRGASAETAYLAKAAQAKGVTKTASGLLYSELKPGKGDKPKATDTVKVHYAGTFTNGVEFDSSYSRKAPTEFPLNGVIKCWTEGVQLMKVGGKSRLVCPYAIAYGEGGQPPNIPPMSTLVFEIELLEIMKKS